MQFDLQKKLSPGVLLLCKGVPSNSSRVMRTMHGSPATRDVPAVSMVAKECKQTTARLQGVR